METKDKSSIILSIFRRKGSEGLLTRIIDQDNRSNHEDILTFLNQGEKGLILYILNTLNWFLLTNTRIIGKTKGVWLSISHGDLIEVNPALQDEFKDGVMHKENFTRLQLRDKSGKCYIIEVEKGGPYQGIYQVLHYLARE